MADRPLRFLLAVHNHQPVGNFESVFARGFEVCYRPFLRAVRTRPSFRFAAHYSGPLLEYMRRRERECWDILTELVRRGQIELLGGGFYEPILAVIPERDRSASSDDERFPRRALRGPAPRDLADGARLGADLP